MRKCVDFVLQIGLTSRQTETPNTVCARQFRRVRFDKHEYAVVSSTSEVRNAVELAFLVSRVNSHRPAIDRESKVKIEMKICGLEFVIFCHLWPSVSIEFIVSGRNFESKFPNFGLVKNLLAIC